MPQPIIIPYDREKALAYAHTWAYRRNPNYFDYEELGGDCTNFASQCLYAGTGVMNNTPTYGWYYFDANQKAPAWTGVPYFYQFITRTAINPGPFGIETSLEKLLPGDFVQLRFNRSVFGHTPIIVAMGNPPTLSNTLIAAHSYDADWRPLDTYYYQEIRFLHIIGAYPPDSGTGGWNEPPQQSAANEGANSPFRISETPSGPPQALSAF